MGKGQIRLGFDSDIMRMLMDFSIPFKATVTNSTIKIDTGEDIYLISPKHLSFKELGFVNQVKRNSEKLELSQQGYTRKDIQYFRFQNLPQGRYTNVAEFDVNSAYWELAYRSGYLREDHYIKGKDVDKMARLVALGSLATTKRHYWYDGTKFIDKREVEVNEITRSYFFHVAKQLDDIMTAIFSEIPNNQKYLYWVDAFFVDRRAEEIIARGLESHGLQYKHKHVKQIHCYFDASSRSKKVVATMVEKRGSTKTDIYLKPFTRPTTAKTEHFIGDSIRLYNKFFR